MSLTIAEVDGGRFSIALIPTTLDRTTLAALSPGDHVNIETDVITRAVVCRLDKLTSGSGLSLNALRNAGMA